MSKIIVTGSNSMIGRPVCRILRERGHEVFPLNHQNCDLLDQQLTLNTFRNIRAEGLIHLAAFSGNLQFNLKYPSDTFYKTTQIGLNALEAARQSGVGRILSVLSSCAIADKGKEVLREEDLWNGLPNYSIESHGFAKRMLDAFSRQLSSQHGIIANCAILTNAFGPYDSFSIEKTKVVGGLIKRFTLAKQEESTSVLCWGSGRALRELIYAPDAAECIVQCYENYNETKLPLNIGSDQEISIKDLSEMIADLVGYKGEILWDLTKTDGQMRKKLCTERMKQFIKHEMTPLASGLFQTIQWYRGTL